MSTAAERSHYAMECWQYAMIGGWGDGYTHGSNRPSRHRSLPVRVSMPPHGLNVGRIRDASTWDHERRLEEDAAGCET
jgi:hypothetical protein